MTDDERVYERRWWTLGILCLSLVMIIVGNTVLNVALPTLIREIDASSTDLQWMVDAYALVFAGLLLTGGALGDRFGRKGALIIGLVIFGAASLLAAISDSASQVIVTRGIMGVGAALVMPATLSILVTVFPPQERGRAIGVWAGLGGRRRRHRPHRRRLAARALLVGLGVPRQHPRDRHRPGGRALPRPHLAATPASFRSTRSGRACRSSAWARSSTPSSRPLPTAGPAAPPSSPPASASPSCCCSRRGSCARPTPCSTCGSSGTPGSARPAAAIMLVFFALFGTFFLLTQYLQLVRGYSALGAGVRSLPAPLTIMVMAPLSSKVVDRFGARWVIASGLSVVALGLAMASFLGTDTPYALLAVCLVILATGMAMTMAPATTSIMSSLPLGKAGVGSAVNDTTRELGGALGVAVLGSLVASHYASSIGSVPGFAGAPGDLARRSLGAALQVAASAGEGGPQLAAAARAAFVDAMSLAFLVAAGVALGAAAMVARFMPGRNDARGIQGAGLGGGAPAGPEVEVATPTPPPPRRSPRPTYTAASEKLALLRR